MLLAHFLVVWEFSRVCIWLIVRRCVVATEWVLAKHLRKVYPTNATNTMPNPTTKHMGHTMIPFAGAYLLDRWTSTMLAGFLFWFCFWQDDYKRTRFIIYLYWVPFINSLRWKECCKAWCEIIVKFYLAFFADIYKKIHVRTFKYWHI